jgi:hypothetical protein
MTCQPCNKSEHVETDKEIVQLSFDIVKDIVENLEGIVNGLVKSSIVDYIPK